MSRNRDPRGRLQREGLLANHYRQGSVFTPELAATVSLGPDDTVRDQVPNLLWILGIVLLDGDDGIRKFCHLQKQFISKCREAGCDPDIARLDGQLSTLAAFGSEHQRILEECIEELGSDEVLATGVLGRALSQYPDAPGTWLFENSDDFVIEDIEFIRDCIISYCVSDHVSGIVRLPSLTWLLLTGKLSGPPAFFELIKEYVDDEVISPLLPSMLRSFNLAERQMQQVRDAMAWDEGIEWAKIFWRTNLTLSQCAVEVHTESADLSNSSDEDMASRPVVSGNLLEVLNEHYQLFIDKAIVQHDYIDLYDPSCHEVVCGLVERSFRLAATWAQYPELWNGVYSNFVQRTLIENTIRLKWMGIQEGDIFGKFQEYGRGKQKLHLEMLRDISRSYSEMGIEMPTSTAELLEQYERDIGFQEEYALPVNVGNFEQVNLRQMAQEADVMDIYRTTYQLTSGVAHCEWEFLEHYEMTRCLEPLHRWHMLPLADHMPPTLEFGFLLQNQFQRLIKIALDVLDRHSN